LGRDEARRQGQGDPIKMTEEKGLKVYQAGEARTVAVGPWLVLTNKDSLWRQVARNLQEECGNTLSGNEDFQAARKTIAGKPTVWSYLNISVLRSVGIGKELFAPKNDNPPGEFLV